MLERTRIFVIMATLLVVAGPLGAQSAHVERLGRLELVIASDSTAFAALVSAAAVATELGEFHADRAQRDSWLARAEQHARRAVAIEPLDAEARFQLARALGRKALTLGARERAKYAVEVIQHARAALASDPDHAGALHIVGLWHQNVMQLSRLERLAAKLLLGAGVFGEASWEEARLNLERAVASEPNRIVHRLDLGRLYAARKQYGAAREQLQWVLAAPTVDYNDDHYKREADEALRRLKSKG